MSAEAITLALTNALNEIKIVCPEVTNTFIFRENGEIIAQDLDTDQDSIENALESFKALSKKADVIGEIDSVTINGENARTQITRFQDFYITNVASNGADEKTVTNLTHVMITSMLKLLPEITPSKITPPETTPDLKPETLLSPGPHLPDIQAHEFTVENLGFRAFLKDPDVAFIDSALISEWMETFGNMHITQVKIQAPDTGKSLVCAFKPFLESKYDGKGIIQLSEKTQLALNLHRGAHILIEPLTESENTSQSLVETNQPSKETPKSPHQDFIRRYEAYAPDPPVSQFMVENLKSFGGFIGSTEFARIDSAVIARWKELFGDKQIDQITIEEVATGRKLCCKFKSAKGSDLEGKGIIQLPDKVQQALQTKKGALVIVKPMVE
jgi:hypothetical protein